MNDNNMNINNNLKYIMTVYSIMQDVLGYSYADPDFVVLVDYFVHRLSGVLLGQLKIRLNIPINRLVFFVGDQNEKYNKAEMLSPYVC